MEHEFQTGDDITNYVDSDQKDGELLDPPTFLATNEFPSDSEQVEENIDITEEKEEVPMKDVEMDENHNIDHLGTEEALQWSLAKDPFLVIMEPNDQLSFLLHTILSFICNEVRGLLESFYAVKWLMKYNKLWHNYNGYGVMFHMIAVTGSNNFSKFPNHILQHLEHGLEHDISSSYRANLRESSI
nr:hypothetical protein [Tanacetum cinerariifolium]